MKKLIALKIADMEVTLSFGREVQLVRPSEVVELLQSLIKEK